MANPADSKRFVLTLDWEADESGHPIPPFVEGGRIRAASSPGLDLTQTEAGEPYDETHVLVDRSGALQLGYKLIALAHAPSDAEENRCHLHIEDPEQRNTVPPATRVTIHLVVSPDAEFDVYANATVRARGGSAGGSPL